MLLFQTPVVIVFFTIFLLYYHIAFGYIVSLILKTLIKAKLFKVKRVLKDGDKILKVSAKLQTCRIASIRNAPFTGITSLSKDRQRTFLLDLSIKNIQFKCILTALIQDGNDPDSQKEANVSLALSVDLLRVNLLSLGLFLTMFRQLGKVVRIMRGEKENKDVLNRIRGVGSNDSELSMLSDVPSIDECNDENFGKSPLYFLKKLIGGFEMKGLIFVSSVKFPCSGFDEDDSEIKFSVTSSKIAAKMGSLQNEADTTLSVVMNGIKSRLKSTSSSQDEVKTPSDYTSLQVKHVQCLMTFKSSAEGQTLASLQVQETKAASGGIVEVVISSEQVKSLKNIFQDHLIQYIQLAESHKAKKETLSISEHDSIHEEEEKEEVTSTSDSTEQIPSFLLQRVAIDLRVVVSFKYTKVEALHLGTELSVGITSHSGDRQTDKANVIVRANGVNLKRSSAGIDQEDQESETVLSTNNFEFSMNNNFAMKEKTDILNKVMRIDIGDLLLQMDDAKETEKVVTSIIATQKAILFMVGTNKNGSGSSREQDKFLKSAQKQESILIQCSSCNFKLSSFCQNEEQNSNRLPLSAFANTSNLQIDINKSAAIDTLAVTSEETKCSLKFFPHSTLPTIDKCVAEIHTGDVLLDGIDHLFPVEFIADVSSFALNLSNSKCESKISSSQDTKIKVSDTVLTETIYDHDFISPLRMNTIIQSDSIVNLSIEESKTIESVHQEINVNTHCKNFQILWSPVLQWYIASVIRTINDTIRFHIPMKQSKRIDNRKVSRLVVVKSNETIVKARATLGGSSVADIQTENILVKVESRQSDTWDKPDILFSSGRTYLNIDEMRSTVAEIDSIRYFNGVRRATNIEIASYEEKRTSSIPLEEEIVTGSCGTPLLETVEISADNKVVIDFPPELHLGKVIEDINTTLRTMEDGLAKARLSKMKTKKRRKYQLMDISLIIPVLDVHFLESVETPAENVLTFIKNGIPKRSPSFIDRWRFLIKGFATKIKRHTPPDVTQGLIRDMDEDKSCKHIYGPMIQGGYFDIKFDRVINTLYPLNLVTPLGDIKNWGIKGFIFLAGLSPETENLFEAQQYCLPVKCHHNNSFSRNFSSKKCSCDYGMIMNSANIPVKIYYDVAVESDLVTSTYGDIVMASIPGLLNIIGRLIPKPPIEDDSRCGKDEIVGPNLDWWDNLRYQFHGGFRWNMKSISFRWLLDTVPKYDWSILLTSKNFVLSQSTGVGSLGMDNVAISIPDSSYHMLDVLPPNAGYETVRRSLTQLKTGFVRRRHPLIYFPKFFTKMTFEWGVLNDDINDPSRHHSVYVFDDERLRASENDKFEYFRSRGWSIDWDFSLDEYADRGSWIALRGDVIPWITHKSPRISDPIDPDENTPDPLPYVNKININVNATKLNIAAWFDEKSDSSIDTSLEEWSEGVYLQIPKFAFTRTGEKGQCYHLFGDVFAALLEINNDFDDIVCESEFSGKQGSQIQWCQRHHDRSIFEINPTHSLGFFESLEISAKNIRPLDYLLEVPEIKILEQSLDDLRGVTTKEDVSDTSAPWTVLVAGMKLLWTVDIRDSIISIVKDILFSINFMTVNLRGTPQLLDANESSTDFDSQSESGENNNAENASNHEESDHAIEMFVEGMSSDVHVVPTTSGPDTTQKSYIKHLLHHHTDRRSSISSPMKQSFGDKRNVLEYSGLQYESSKSPIIPTFDLHLSNPQIQFHSEKTGGSVIIGIRGAYIEGKKFVKLLAKNESFDKEDFRLETLLRRTEFLYTLDRMELYSVSNDVDVDVGLQWLHLSKDVSSDCPESKILARCWEFPPDYDVFSTRNFLLPKTGTAVSRIMDPSTFKTRQEFHRPPIDLTKEELEEVIDYNQILPLEIDRNNALDSLEFFIDELSFHLDSHQFRTTFDVIRNTMLEPLKPRKERYYQQNNDSNNDDEKKSSEQKFKEKLIAESKKRKAEALTPANEMQKLLKAPNKTSKKWKEAAREVASRLVAEFEDGDRKSKNDVSIRRIEYNLCKAKWKIAATEEASINDTEINFTDFKGVHNFSADGAVSSVISLEDMHVTSLRPSEEASSFEDRSVIIKTILGEELSPCQRCGENFDRNSNEVNSCRFHPGVYARRDGSLEWSCCGDANEDATGCIARPHTGSETAMDIRFNAYPRVLEGLTLYEFIEVNVYPGATHKTLVQLTRSLTSSLMNYFLGDSNDVLNVSPGNLIDTEGSIVTSARQSDVSEHSLYTHSSPSDIIEERDSKYNDESRRYLLFGETNSRQDTICASSKASKTKDKKNAQSKVDNGKKTEKSEIVFLQKWNIGDINIHLSVAGFHRIIDIYDLPLKVAPFQRAYKIGPFNHIVKKYVAHLVKNLLASSMGILKVKFTGHRHGTSLEKAPALIEDATSESENHAKEERDEVDASAILLAPPTTAAKKKKKLRIFGRRK